MSPQCKGEAYMIDASRFPDFVRVKSCDGGQWSSGQTFVSVAEAAEEIRDVRSQTEARMAVESLKHSPPAWYESRILQGQAGLLLTLLVIALFLRLAFKR